MSEPQPPPPCGIGGIAGRAEVLPSLRLERKSCALNHTKRQLGVSEEGTICPSPFVGEALHPPPSLAFTSSFLLDLCSDCMGRLVSILGSALSSQRTTGRRVSPSQPNCPGPSCSGVGPLDHYQGLIDSAYLVGSGAPDPRTQSRTRINLPRIPHRMPQDRSPESLLRENTFYLQFNNGHRVQPVQHRYYQRKTYLCYQLERCSDQEPLKGCLQNKKGKHAEILFIDEMRSLKLGQERITCYLTWSPCPNCAQELVAFKRDHPCLVLRIYASRLYFHWRRKYQEGLCSMWRSGIQVDVMDLPQFTDCWINFVNPQVPFRPWKELEKNSRCIQRRLGRIKESWGLQDLMNDLENLQLGPPLS
uniref:DNA dC->dU-editing enzyme APOBEC3-like isoform X3 n=1 Tax=Myodes glareolus TaxID=447135 RepID=UPI0020208AAA|nr:DNA dC->dU-editing enzyme APOBEC3-like isoform X3 [Myodes glareolus]